MKDFITCPIHQRFADDCECLSWVRAIIDKAGIAWADAPEAVKSEFRRKRL